MNGKRAQNIKPSKHAGNISFIFLRDAYRRNDRRVKESKAEQRRAKESKEDQRGAEESQGEQRKTKANTREQRRAKKRK